MTTAQNLIQGLNVPDLLLYDHPNTLLDCIDNKIKDDAVNWANGGFVAAYQCVQGHNGQENYCRRRNTNGPVHAPGVFGAWQPRFGPSDLYTDCKSCNLSCSGAALKP